MLKVSNVLRSLLGAFVILAPGLAHGEAFLDFAVGGAFTQKDKVRFEARGFHETSDTDFRDSFSTGVRGGYWFEELPWLGVGGMVSYFEPDLRPDDTSGFDSENFGVIPFTALLMLRAPLLVSPEMPHGQFQPYLNIGPGAFVTVIEDDDHHHHYDYDYDYDDDFDDDYDDDYDSSVDFGFDAHAGATWMFNSRFGFFAEYRFTYFDADIEGDSDFSGSDISLESTLATHHILAGFAWHFD